MMRLRPRPDDVRLKPRPRIFFEAEVEANNYEAGASCKMFISLIFHTKICRIFNLSQISKIHVIQ